MRRRLMGLLVDGAWQDVDMRVQANGQFVRRPTFFHNYITADGGPGPTGKGGFPRKLAAITFTSRSPAPGRIAR